MLKVGKFLHGWAGTITLQYACCSNGWAGQHSQGPRFEPGLVLSSCFVFSGLRELMQSRDKTWKQALKFFDLLINELIRAFVLFMVIEKFRVTVKYLFRGITICCLAGKLQAGQGGF
jgi:hypothetical protein